MNYLARFASVALAVGFLGLVLPTRSASAGASSAMLARSLPELKFDGVGLSDTIDFLRDVSGANINVNWKALAEANIQKDTPITVRLYGVPVRKALSVILAEASGGEPLTFFVDDGVIEITTKAIADKIMYIKVYPVEDLLMEIPNFADSPKFDLAAASGSNNGNSGGGGGGAGGGGGGNSSGLFGQGGNNTATQEPVKTKDQRTQELVDLIKATISPEIWSDAGGTASIRYFNGSLVVSAPRSVHEALGGAID